MTIGTKPRTHGGRRKGAGRKPAPVSRVALTCKVMPDLAEWYDLEAGNLGMTRSAYIAFVLDRHMTQVITSPATSRAGE